MTEDVIALAERALYGTYKGVPYPPFAIQLARALLAERAEVERLKASLTTSREACGNRGFSPPHRGIEGETDMTEWQPIATAPRDGEVFLVSDEDGFIQVCFIDSRKEKSIMKKRWPWSKPTKKIIEEAVNYWCYALPYNRAYTCLAMRRDSYQPTHWMPLPEPPE